jgi:hypothetical protein
MRHPTPSRACLPRAPKMPNNSRQSSSSIELRMKATPSVFLQTGGRSTGPTSTVSDGSRPLYGAGEPGRGASPVTRARGRALRPFGRSRFRRVSVSVSRRRRGAARRRAGVERRAPATLEPTPHEIGNIIKNVNVARYTQVAAQLTQPCGGSCATRPSRPAHSERLVQVSEVGQPRLAAIFLSAPALNSSADSDPSLLASSWSKAAFAL